MLELYKTIDIHLVASNYMKRRLVQHGFSTHHIKVISFFTELQPTENITAIAPVPTVTFVGRIDRYKGVDFLMRALAKVNAPLRCCVIGDGDYLPYCKDLSQKLGIADRVDFVGWLSRDKVTGHLANSYLIVVPSIWPEPFGLVGLEAMTCSKPVVAFDTGGISDWLQDGVNGYLVPVKNTDLLAQRIDALLRDQKQADKMGAEGSRIVKASFGKEQHFRNLLSTFEFAADRRRLEAVNATAVPAINTA
jgi:glycosyltransferase involved in cell wall biosynthesis